MIRKGRWEHNRSGRLYDVLNTVKLKYAEQWVDAVLYTDNQGELFVRPLKLFKEKFTEHVQTDN